MIPLDDAIDQILRRNGETIAELSDRQTEWLEDLIANPLVVAAAVSLGQALAQAVLTGQMELQFSLRSAYMNGLSMGIGIGVRMEREKMDGEEPPA